MKKYIEAKTFTNAVTNTKKYLQKSGFDTFGFDEDKLKSEPGYCQRFSKPGAECWVSYISKNKFFVEIL